MFLTYLKKVVNTLSQFYLILLCCGLPLFYVSAYTLIGTMKWKFFRAVTLGFTYNGISFPGLLLMIIILSAVNYYKEADLSVLKGNRWLLLYLFAVLISFINAEDKSIAVEGYSGWYMGIIAQTSFVFIYLCAKEYGAGRLLKMLICISSCFIMMLVILNRFWIYPFGIAEGFEKNVLKGLVSTIGNINWCAGYLSCVIPIAFGFYTLADSDSEKILALIWVVISSVSIVLLDSDSIIAALFCIVNTYPSLFRKNPERFCRVLKLIFLIGASWCFTGVIYRSLADLTVPLGELSCSLLHPVTGILLMICSGSFLYSASRSTFSGEKWLEKQFMFFLTAEAAAVILMLIWLYMNSSYLDFGDTWASNRGLIWRVSVDSWFKTMQTMPLKTVFGWGPDHYYKAVYHFHETALRAVYKSTIVTNAHNEYLTSIINYGLIGGICYILSFGYELSFLMKRHSRNPVLCIGIACIIGYMTNNFFSFQQIISTPMIFALMGFFHNTAAQDIQLP